MQYDPETTDQVHTLGDWIELPPGFDLNTTISRVMLAKVDNPHLDDSTEHLQIYSSPPSPSHSRSPVAVPSPLSSQSSPLSSPPSTRSSSPAPQPKSLYRANTTTPAVPSHHSLPSNCSSPLSSPPSSRSSSPAPPQPEYIYGSTESTTNKRKTRRSKKKKGSRSVSTPTEKPTQRSDTAKAHRRRQKKRKLQQQAPDHIPQTRSNTLLRVLVEGKPIKVKWDSQPAMSNSSGYIGKDGVTGGSKVWKLEDLIGKDSAFKFKLIRWDGRVSMPLIDSAGRIFAVLVGYPPKDQTWESVHKAAADLLQKYAADVAMESNDPSRQGVTIYISVGYSFGGGQKFPKLFNQEPSNQAILDELLSSECFQRISGHVSSAFLTWAPKLHHLYAETIAEYQAKDPSFSKNFPGTSFMAATFNFDQQTESVEHLDYFNYIFGWCGITSLGSFDYTKEGHLILWDLKLVIEFPPGTSILIPSCYLRHSNTAVGRDKTRFSFTEYSAGGLFRYSDDGLRTRVSMSDSERKEREREARARVVEGIDLYSTLDELLNIARYS
ncbi:hypothetical protein VKT23_008213 [Stygiomarasmius scandens]|uniref:Uncharacterized protein n=1 Tax=Marasmiellus scandens TaxID=2682957 RepID=A0ABR1JMY2_9AGAR